MSSSTRLRLRSCLPRTHTLTLRVRITARAHAEVRVCSNKTCRKQTSAQTLALMTDAAPLDIHVDSCGCLGNCGNGPNVLVLNRETSEETVVNHVSTPAQAAKLLASLTSIDVSFEQILAAMEVMGEVRKRMYDEHDEEAEALLTNLLERNLPTPPRYTLLEYRAASRRRLGKLEGALDDANEATSCCPEGHGEPWIQRADVLRELGELDKAMQAILDAGDIERALRSDARYRSKKRKLKQQVQQAHA
ncbi:hypothetical protein PPROV_000731800 [Pycnococcus provasolii]|uniref:Uncharacterized protein n=1 Tax=Pycnococcus provasolii TaxID=41880 RepID=A0A6T5WP10_9CHLO|nr:hypothetical protein PPROV_000731800 [Pycnococcus provasolii]|mmetsp:Transcript_3219/g.7281  ORF Transcript_3219/g.7281 Transcript_3219/m.7281 type:complete len:248 (+) Transcript_3219:36-779(+)